MSEFVYRDGELYHYGVLGMKWGIRRGNTAKAYEKASKKLQKLDKKADKALERARAKRVIADRKMDSVFSTRRGRLKANRNANRAMRKAVSSAAKARTWLNTMDRNFSKTNISLAKEQINLGRKYIETLDKRTFR